VESGAESTAGGGGTLITMSPAVTEIAFALGLGGRVVAVSDFCNYPEEAHSLPKCGAYLNPNLEVIRTLRPGLLVYQGDYATLRKYCEETGQNSLSVRLDTLNDLYRSAEAISQAAGVPRAGRKLVLSIQEDLAHIAQRTSGWPRARVFLCCAREPGSLRGMMTCSKGTFLDELIYVAGGDNMLHGSPSLYPTPSLEEVVAGAPEVILDLAGGAGADSGDATTGAAEWAALATVPAVREGHVYVLSDDYLQILGPRVAQTAARFAEAIHPGSAAGDG
jgi:iron complex transport system substrate-binding protein